MPSLDHQAPLFLIDKDPDLLPRLIRTCLGVKLPDYIEARVTEADFSQLVPAEYDADKVLLLHTGARHPIYGIISEVQRSCDEDKRYTWPLYTAALRARWHCPTCLVILALVAFYRH